MNVETCCIARKLRKFRLNIIFTFRPYNIHYPCLERIISCNKLPWALGIAAPWTWTRSIVCGSCPLPASGCRSNWGQACRLFRRALPSTFCWPCARTGRRCTKGTELSPRFWTSNRNQQDLYRYKQKASTTTNSEICQGILNLKSYTYVTYPCRQMYTKLKKQ